MVDNTLLTVDEVQLTTTQWSNDIRELYMLITRSPAYIRDLEMFFEVKSLNNVQSADGAKLMLEIYK